MGRLSNGGPPTGKIAPVPRISNTLGGLLMLCAVLVSIGSAFWIVTHLLSINAPWTGWLIGLLVWMGWVAATAVLLVLAIYYFDQKAKRGI